ncbi:hypothetical protein HOR75_gp12 [Shewanella phage SppYZU05]|uniref:Uncharacterized protein n=1 Tax=Shewanella phage SppYZU05 TaxID=1970795 RepID=A0A1W6JTE3_9CAUD|nr:hypothetical protein HOR75_gp12 [Shewanella phage SppYZU05]ARM70538.1 hypothetical protein SppYZU05_12 [Shewanella phage SppYZU05]
MKQYSFAAVDLFIDEVQIEGFPDADSVINIGRDADQHAKVMDARGKMVAVSSADKSGTAFFDILQTSDSAQWLQTRALLTQDIATSGGSDLFIPIQLRLVDKMGKAVATGVNGMMVRQPGFARGTGLAVERWVLQFEQVWMLRGQSGNAGL